MTKKTKKAIEIFVKCVEDYKQDIIDLGNSIDEDFSKHTKGYLYCIHGDKIHVDGTLYEALNYGYGHSEDLSIKISEELQKIGCYLEPETSSIFCISE